MRANHCRDPEERFLGAVKTIKGLVTLPANTETSSTCTTCKNIDDYTVLIEPADDATLPQGLMLHPTIDIVKQGKVTCRLMYFSDVDIILHKPLKVGNICTCEIVTPDLDITLDEEGEAVIDYHTPDPVLGQRGWHNLPFSVEMGDIRTNKSENRELCNIFSRDKNDLGFTDKVVHHIKTTDDVPVKQRDRRIPPQAVSKVRNMLTDWIKAGIIKESDSPYASQMVLVKKKSGEIRVCIDYRQLNQMTIKDAFPLPRIEDCIESLKGARYFSSLDLTQGYLQVKVHEADQHKTAFRALGALYEFNRLSFGLCNSPATFSRLMGRCLGDMCGQGIIIYLDDILVYSSSIPEMTSRLNTVFQRLQSFGLKVRPEKCHFFKHKVSFLGHTVSADGVETDPVKISAVKDYPKPTTEKKLRQFLGLTSYFRRFVHGFAQIAGPLTDILSTGTRQQKKRNRDISQHWTPECQQAFELLKKKLTHSPVLGFPDFDKAFTLEVDASIKGYGAILFQTQSDRKVVIAYASRRLRKHERTMKNYSSMKLEFLALHWAVTRKFCEYLYGSQFLILTDSHPLSRILQAKQTAADSSKLAELSDFQFEIKYRSGKTNVAADALSRNPISESPSDTDSDEDCHVINSQQELVAYIERIQCTYSLLFGRNPRLPIDNILSSFTGHSPSDLTDYVQLHQRRMEQAIKWANAQLTKKAAERKRRHNKSVKVSDIKVGRCVLLRNRVIGRNKIQDVWSSVPYKVVGTVTDGSCAYIVQSPEGKAKVVNRVDLLEFDQPEDEESTQDAELINSSETNQSSSEDEVVMMTPNKNATPNLGNLRRTKRATAGKHSNPFNLPRSVTTEEIQTSKPQYTEYTGVIVELGRLLQTSYDESLQS